MAMGNNSAPEKSPFRERLPPDEAFVDPHQDKKCFRYVPREGKQRGGRLVFHRKEATPDDCKRWMTTAHFVAEYGGSTPDAAAQPSRLFVFPSSSTVGVGVGTWEDVGGDRAPTSSFPVPGYI